jgi:hypothetical protein
MIRKPIAIAMLVAAASSVRAEPAQAASAFEYVGQLGYFTADGIWTPLIPDAVLLGWGDGGCELSAQSPERLPVSQKILSIITVGPDGSAAPPTPEVITWPCYRFHVTGCEDAIVPFGPTRPSRGVSSRRDG